MLFQAVVAGTGMSGTVIAAVCVQLAHTRAAVILKLPGLNDGELGIHRGQGFLSVVLLVACAWQAGPTFTAVRPAPVLVVKITLPSVTRGSMWFLCALLLALSAVMTGSAWASRDGAAGSSTNATREMVTIHASSSEDEADNDQSLPSAADAGSSASASPSHIMAGRSFYPQLPSTQLQSTLGANDGPMIAQIFEAAIA